MKLINILTLIFMLISLLTEFKKDRISSPLVVFCGIWSVVLFFYSLRLYGIYAIKEETAWLIFAALISFVFGYNLVKKIKIVDHYETIYTNWNMINLICVVIIVISFPYYLQSLLTMLRGGISAAAYKLLLVSGEADSGNFIIQYIVRPFEFLIMGMSAYVFSKSIKNRLVFWAGIYICVVKFFTTGSKSAILYYGLSLALAMFNNSEIDNWIQVVAKLELKQKITIFSAGIAFFASVVASSGQFLKSIYLYLAGCLPMLDHVIHDPFYFSNENMHGWVSFNGIARFFINLLEIIGFTPNTVQFDKAANIITKFEYTILISSDIKYNAFVTFISDFYIDFASVGVVIGSMIFGGVVCFIYRRYQQDKSVARYAQLSLLYYMVIFSIVRFQLSHTVIAMAFIYSILLIPMLNIRIILGRR